MVSKPCGRGAVAASDSQHPELTFAQLQAARAEGGLPLSVHRAYLSVPAVVAAKFTGLSWREWW